ncbi:MAG: glycine--tRNA ligase subunit beta [Pseudomonadota bacterium]
MAEHVADLLVEIGTEEMPPKALKDLSQAFAEELIKGLEAHGLISQSHACYATPRRLAVRINALAHKQQDRLVERKGPALKAAFDPQGNPTRAAQGFARSCGVEVAALQQLQTPAEVWLVHRVTKPGRSTMELVPELVEQALARLPIPRRMRWGSGATEFVRPVHWVVLLFGDQLIETAILGIRAGRESRGHRFHYPGPLEIATPAHYCEVLKKQGKVLVDFELRRDRIKLQVQDLAGQLGGQVLFDDALLDEVTSLVEWPWAISGGFDEDFLKIPPEVLISTMQDNQKYFPVVDDRGTLLPYFIAISNIESRAPEKVREGNERVIRPRFRDAEFFWRQDCKTTLASRRESLKEMVFQHKLGTLFDKSQRLVGLTQTVAQLIGVDVQQAQRAAELSKCDLLTDMVNEFPKLQGTMGRYYARNDGETAEVAVALDEQYMPRQAGSELPQTGVGKCLALADRLDTLVGIFAIGLRPTGMKDPFGLRRAALGALRIIIEGELELDLNSLLSKVADGFPAELAAHKIESQVFDFTMDRLRSYYLDSGVSADVFEAVLVGRPRRPMDFDRRIRAVVKFRNLPEATSLSLTNKRIRNILRKADGQISSVVEERLLLEPAEKILHQRLAAMTTDVVPLFDQGKYEPGLLKLAGLREPVDQFFDEVMVMVDDELLRSNRIALLHQLSQLFLRTADLSRLQH